MHLRTAHVLTLLVAALTMVHVPAASAAAPLRDCGNARGPLAENVVDIRARNTVCREAHRVTRNVGCAGERRRQLSSRGKAGRYDRTVRRTGTERSRIRCTNARRVVAWTTQV